MVYLYHRVYYIQYLNLNIFCTIQKSNRMEHLEPNKGNASGFVIVHVGEKKYILMLKNGYEGRLWAPPGGKIDKSAETPLSAFKREVEEETGLTGGYVRYLGLHNNCYMFRMDIVGDSKLIERPTCRGNHKRAMIHGRIHLSFEHSTGLFVPLDWMQEFIKIVKSNGESYKSSDLYEHMLLACTQHGNNMEPMHMSGYHGDKDHEFCGIARYAMKTFVKFHEYLSE